MWCRERRGAGPGGGPSWSLAGGHPPALGRDQGKALGPHAAPQLPVRDGAQASGPLGVVRGCRGKAHKVDPVTAVTSWVGRKAGTPSHASGAGMGGWGTGAAP